MEDLLKIWKRSNINENIDPLLIIRGIGEKMSEVPENLFYTAEHEWIRVEDSEVVVGITDHAQDALTDIVYVELPDVGLDVGKDEEFASVESVKSVSASPRRRT